MEQWLWEATGGLFQPEERSPSSASTAVPARGRGRDPSRQLPLISVICPTGASRRCFHKFLWMCFSIQSYQSKELIIIETCEDEPSEFFLERMREDKRVVYRHFPVPEKQWSIGLKRNIACHLAAGDVIAHFDDDDMYGPNYLEEMLKFMSSPMEAFKNAFPHLYKNGLQGKMLESLGIDWPVGDGQALEYSLQHVKQRAGLGPHFGAACAKLCCWHEYTLQNRSWSVIDASELGAKTLYGWGFSSVYLKAAWQARPFRNMGLGEDFDFVWHLRTTLCLPVVLIYDTRGICAHTCHSANTTGMDLERKRFGGSSAAMYSQVASLVGLYDSAAKTILQEQEQNKPGSEAPAIKTVWAAHPPGQPWRTFEGFGAAKLSR